MSPEEKAQSRGGRAKEGGSAGEAGTGAGDRRRGGNLKAEAKPGVAEKSTGDEAADKAIKEGGGIGRRHGLRRVRKH